MKLIWHFLAANKEIVLEKTHEQLENTIYQYDYSVSSFEGRHIVTKDIGNMIIQVVYNEEINTIIIITVY